MVNRKKQQARYRFGKQKAIQKNRFFYGLTYLQSDLFRTFGPDSMDACSALQV